MLKIINLEDGFPTVEQARQRMLRELRLAQQSGCRGVKLIHGYGSSGVGGEIRIAIGRSLREMKERGDLSVVIFGEDWAVSDPASWTLIKQHTSLKKDADLGKRNRGITVVWF